MEEGRNEEGSNGKEEVFERRYKKRGGKGIAEGREEQVGFVEGEG